jgi:hypothetical protein
MITFGSSVKKDATPTMPQEDFQKSLIVKSKVTCNLDRNKGHE